LNLYRHLAEQATLMQEACAQRGQAIGGEQD
jgi:hypothetical protein